MGVTWRNCQPRYTFITISAIFQANDHDLNAALFSSMPRGGGGGLGGILDENSRLRRSSDLETNNKLSPVRSYVVRSEASEYIRHQSTNRGLPLRMPRLPHLDRVLYIPRYRQSTVR